MSAADTEQRAERPLVAKRITIGLIRKVLEELERLQHRTGMTSTDIINRSISLAAFVDDQTRDGKELFLRDPKTGESGRVHLL
jgi:hypothetical protein